MNKNQRGFSIVESLLIVVVLGLIGFAGWFIWQKNNNDKKATTEAQTTQKKLNQETKKSFTVPKDYTTYANEQLGFSFAYPQEWGKLAPSTDTALAYYNAVTPRLENKSIGNSYLSNFLGYHTHSTDDFTISAKKYGATVAPVASGKNYKWKVVEVNPADTVDKVGDIYPIKTTTSVSGVAVYDFSALAEELSAGRLVFKSKGSFVTIDMPGMHRTNQEATSTADRKLYDTIIKNIQDSITVK